MANLNSENLTKEWAIFVATRKHTANLKQESILLQMEGRKLMHSSFGSCQGDLHEHNILSAIDRQRFAEGSVLCAKADKILAEASILGAEAEHLWTTAVVEEFGNIMIEYIVSNPTVFICRLGVGTEFST